MQPSALRALEFDRIVEAVAGFALTPMGAERLSRLAPSTDAAKVAQLLAATTETARFLAAHGLFPLRATADLPNTLTALAVEGRPLEAARLLALVAFLESIDQSRAAIRAASGSFPLLEAASGPAASFKVESAAVRAKIDPAGDIVDDASPALKGIRDRLRKQRTRLRTTLESYLRGKDTSKYLQDQVVTERSGRYVLVVKAEHRASIPGIVHGSSTSGASLFLEPLSTVEINNDIVALEEQEQEEVRRILLALTDAFRARAADLARTIDAATELDVLQGRARFSESIDGIEPALSADGAFELQAARHPLLKNAVPVTIKVIPPATVLLITGPNTGGKTVALKTAGLLALMAQSGLRIPAADGSRLPVFRSLFADIGDEQSIEANLSTFSAHISNIASMDRALAVPALVLLDEIGSGTDPIEGGALGVAIVDHFKQRGATVIATSHYDALKTYASTTDGVASAAFGFDPETFAPTYELLYGSPGRSLALEIAARIGLPAAVVASARQNLSAREAQLAEHLAKIDRDMRALEHEQRLAARERETLSDAEARLRQREEVLRQREETARTRLADQLDAQTREARKQIDEVIAELKAKAAAIASAPRLVSTGETGAARSEARAAVDAVAARIASGDTAQVSSLNSQGSALNAQGSPSHAPSTLSVGARVIVGGLGLEAVVTAIHDGTADLDVRGKRMRASVRDLRIVGGAPAAAQVRVNVDLQPRETTAADLNVIGCTVDEAIARAERFLDESLLTDQRVVRFIHGYGTGQLKRALAGFLQQHPLVARFATAPPEQGGGGVTVVELKE
ncbi:MAG TPA: Smr/MutS family protein [Vicinamibacterales bacterium]|nr:Smr/MutS family protein [Vicinamibacterales bacterium]